MGNQTDRNIIKLQEYKPNYYRISFPAFVARQLRAKKGTLFEVKFWPPGSKVIMEGGGITVDLIVEDD